MGKYKIKIGPSKVPPAVIEKHQDFDKMLGNYQDLYKGKKLTKNLYRNYRLVGVLIVVLTLLLVMIFDKEKMEENNEVKSKVEQKEKNTTPIKE